MEPQEFPPRAQTVNARLQTEQRPPSPPGRGSVMIGLFHSMFPAATQTQLDVSEDVIRVTRMLRASSLGGEGGPGFPAMVECVKMPSRKVLGRARRSAPHRLRRSGIVVAMVPEHQAAPSERHHLWRCRSYGAPSSLDTQLQRCRPFGTGTTCPLPSFQMVGRARLSSDGP